MRNPVYKSIKYIGFGLVGFYGISTIEGYLMPTPVYIYIYIYKTCFYGMSTTIGY